MKKRSRIQGKPPKTCVTPQEAVRRIAVCQLSGHLQGSSVFVKADAGTSQLLNAACLGRPYIIAQQVVQTVKGSAEHTGGALNPGDTASGASASLDLPAEISSKGDLVESLERSSADCTGEGGIAAAALGHGEIWGATCEIGTLGVMPIKLPALQAARVDSHPGIALSRSAADSVRQHVPEKCSAEEPQQHMEVPKKQKQPRRRGKYAEHIRSAQQELQGPTDGWLLSLEEAFFMHYALECLTVSGTKCIQELWERCMHLKRSFAHSYLPFHHFRSKGWVVRPGADYGVDYVLYDGHPSEVHSSYCVLALTGSKCPELLQWTDIEAASRVCSEVLKKLLLLYVFEEPGASIATPDYVSAVSVEERLVQRWSPGIGR